MMEKTGFRTAALHNLGCKVNAYETEAMQQRLEEAGYRIVAFEERADVYVINTCSVTGMADKKSRQMLHRARRRNPDAVIVAAGCYVQTAAEKNGPCIDADLILGNNRKNELVPALERLFESREKEDAAVISDITVISREHDYEKMQIARTAEHTRAFIKVQDGCNQFCSYCIIPYARGRVRSREEEDVLSEVGRLTESGIREIVLTGIHLSSYGCDRDTSLAELIRSVATVPGVRRIRLGSLEPGIVTEEFAGILSSIPEVCPHFHLSLQSGCDTVLERMHRRYSCEEYLERCRILRRYFDQPALTTDVITGFPGETREEHEKTVAFLRQVGFYETHIFKYSRREGTLAASMPDQVPEEVKNERSRELIELGLSARRRYEESWQGKEAQALMEEAAVRDGVTGFTGYTKEYIRVFVPSDDDLSGRICSGILENGPAARPGEGERAKLFVIGD